MIALTRPDPEETWGQDLWVLQAPILEDSSAEDIDNGFETEVRSECLRRTRLRGTINSNLRRNQSLKRSQDARLLSQAWIWEKLVFLIQITRKKTFPWQQASVNPQITRWLTLTRIHGLANKQSAWSWQLHNTESLAWSWRHRATPGTKLLIQDLPWKLHKAAAWSKNTGFPGDRIGARS